jgi:hypothetical protein
LAGGWTTYMVEGCRYIFQKLYKGFIFEDELLSLK